MARTSLFADEHRADTIRKIEQALARATVVDVAGKRKLRQSPRSLATLLFDELAAQARDVEQQELFTVQ